MSLYLVTYADTRVVAHIVEAKSEADAWRVATDTPRVIAAILHIDGPLTPKEQSE